MAIANAYAAFQRVRQEDGSYSIVYPINTSDEVYVDINSKLTLTSKLNTMEATISANKESVIEDMVAILASLAPMYPKPLLLNHLFVDDFGANTTMTTTKGIKLPGKIVI